MMERRRWISATSAASGATRRAVAPEGREPARIRAAMGERRIDAGAERRRYDVAGRRNDGGDAAHGGAWVGGRVFSLPVFGEGGVGSYPQRS